MMIRLTLSTARGAARRTAFVPDGKLVHLPRPDAMETGPEGNAWLRRGGVLRKLEGAFCAVTLALLLALGAGAVNEAVGWWARI